MHICCFPSGARAQFEISELQAIKEREEEEAELEMMAGASLTQRIARNRRLMQMKREREEDEARRRAAGEDPEAELTGGSSRRPSRLLSNLEAFFDLLHDVWAHAPSPDQCGTLDLDTQQELAESKLRTLEEFQDHYMETERMY